jgi:hypothetical protein
MKGCWIRILGTGALVISAFGQTGVGLQAPAINSVLGSVSPDKSSITAIPEAEVALLPVTGLPSPRQRALCVRTNVIPITQHGAPDIRRPTPGRNGTSI